MLQICFTPRTAVSVCNDRRFLTSHTHAVSDRPIASNSIAVRSPAGAYPRSPHARKERAVSDPDGQQIEHIIIGHMQCKIAPQHAKPQSKTKTNAWNPFQTMAIHPDNDQTLNKLFAGGVIAACQKPAL
jgi:hypothetical protein